MKITWNRWYLFRSFKIIVWGTAMLCDCIAQHQWSAGAMEGGSMAPIFNNDSVPAWKSQKNSQLT